MTAASTPASAPATQAVIHADNADYTFMSWGQCICQLWHRDMSAEALQAFFDLVDVALRTQKGELVFLIVAEEAARPPAAALRSELARHLQRVQQHISRSAVVHEGTGFHASVVRSFITGFSAIFRANYPRSVFSNVEDAVRWLSADPRAGLDVTAFLEALGEVRRTGPAYAARAIDP